VVTSPSIDWEEIANCTEGYSGADLQALVYNAHLQVVHASIAAHPVGDKDLKTREEDPVEYTILGGSANKGPTSRAEEIALQRRVSKFSVFDHANKVTRGFAV
jgi:peroxin-1